MFLLVASMFELLRLQAALTESDGPVMRKCCGKAHRSQNRVGYRPDLKLNRSWWRGPLTRITRSEAN